MRRKIYLENLCARMGLPPTTTSLIAISKLYNQTVDELSSSKRVTFGPSTAEHNELYAMSEFLSCYLRGRGEVLVVSPPFFEDLVKTVVDVPVDLLSVKCGDAIMIELPRVYLSPDGSRHSAAIINVGRFDLSSKIMTRFRSGEPSEDAAGPLAFCMIAPDLDKNGAPLNTSSYLVAPLHRGKTISEIVSEFPETDLSVSRDFLDAVFKTMLYVSSEGPDILRSAGKTSGSRHPHKQKNFLRAYCPFDTTTVGYSYRGLRARNVEETGVSGHFRWQRCGAGFSSVKLIWIEEHTRNYTATHQTSRSFSGQA